ncbi:MAG: Lrp/AsnC family transcriptional regulator [Candidatus Micrarchaeia archaeon]
MKNEQLDNVDRLLLTELRKDCRASYRELARRVGMSPAAVIEHMKQMEKGGMIKGYSASLDFLKLGYEFMGLVRIAIEPGKLLDAEEKIGKLKGVYAVYDVTGEYDAVAFVVAKTRTEFSALIKKILGTPYVRKTNTDTVLNVVKDPFSFNEI